MANSIQIKRRDNFFLRPNEADVKVQVPKTKCEPILNEKYTKKTFKSKDDNDKADKVKVPFDKKKYRLMKYSNKHKMQQWENNRRQKILRKYHKDIAGTSPIGTFKPFSFDEDIKKDNDNIEEQDGIQKEEQVDEVGKFVKHPDLMKLYNKKIDNKLTIKNKPKNSAFWKAKEEFKKAEIEKLNKIEKAMKTKEEKKVALEKYKHKKTENFKKLNQKTKRGQPVMTGRLELLLSKIQSTK